MVLSVTFLSHFLKKSKKMHSYENNCVHLPVFSVVCLYKVINKEDK